MTTPLVVYPDPIPAAIDALRDGLTGRTEPYAQDVRYGVSKPDTGAPLPLVQVANDGGPVTHPVVTRPLIRVTVWHVGEAYAHDLAQLCQGLLLSHSGDALSACYGDASPVGGGDEQSQTYFSTLTVRAVLRGRTL